MSGGGVFESNDGGDDWQPLNAGCAADFNPNPDIEFGHDPQPLLLEGVPLGTQDFLQGWLLGFLWFLGFPGLFCRLLGARVLVGGHRFLLGGLVDGAWIGFLLTGCGHVLLPSWFKQTPAGRSEKTWTTRTGS